ncbi:hypothetical protein BDV19DRAFT_366574 [Aspergillus venezuelensis]
MPPPASQRAEIEPPEEITSEAVRGFLHGAFRFGSVSILAHMIMILPHPFKFSPSANTPSPSPSPASGPPAPIQTQEPSPGHSQNNTHTQNTNPRRPSPFSAQSIKSRLFYRPLEGFSEWLSPTARIYRGLTPQFKVYLQVSAMTLGGVVWAERRVNEYINTIRKVKRAERLQAQREQRYLE